VYCLGWSVSRIASPVGILSKVLIKCLGWSVSRILSNRVESGLRPPKGVSSLRPVWAIISLGDASPRRSSGPPGTVRRRAASLPSEDDIVPAWPCSWRGLPGRPHYGGRRWSLTPPFHHHRPRPLGARPAVCFCGPSPAGSLQRSLPAPDVIRRHALWSADFPRSCKQNRDRPTSLRRFHHTRVGSESQLNKP
jgi:hypothetical protein